MTPQPPPGQGPIDPRGAFSPPPAPGGMTSSWQTNAAAGGTPPPPPPPGMMPPMPPQFPQMYPPPMFMPPPPRPHRSFTRAIFVTLATTIFGISLTLNIYLLLASGFLSGGSSKQTSLLEGDPHQKVAVVPVSGTIFDDMSRKFDRWMSAVDKDGDVKALVIEVDSPGGSVTASDEMLHRIQRYKNDHSGVPVIISMGGLAASGGYYVSCGGDYLFAQPTTLTGNIGVLLPQYNVSKLFDKWGISENTIVSSGATFKNAGSMFQPETPEARAYLQDIADKAFAQFKSVVRTGRTGHTNFKTPELDNIANGKIYTAEDAKKIGLIDDIGYQQDAYEYAAKKAGLNKMTVVRYHDPPSFFDAFSGESNVSNPHASASGTGANGITINGVNVNANEVRELLTPRLLYLWRGQ